MADVIQTLFGITANPAEQVKDFRTKQAMDLGALYGAATANQYASPERQKAYIAKQAAQSGLVSRGVNAVAGLLGLQDPMLQKQAALEGIFSQTQQSLGANASDPTKLYPALIKNLMDNGLTQEAAQVNAVAQKAIPDYLVSRATVAEKEATALAKLREKEDPFVKTLEAAGIMQGSPEFIEAMKSKIEKELSIETDTKETTRGVILFNKLTGEEIANLGMPIDKSTKLNVSTGDKASDLILKEVDVPLYKTLRENVTAARALARDTRTIQNLLKNAEGGMVTKLSTKLAKDFGLSNENVTTQDLANALATRGAVGIRAVGSGSTSDLEFKAYLEAFPSLGNSAPGRELMAKYAEKFAARQELLSDKVRSMLKSKEGYSDTALQAYDDSLGPVLGDDFNTFTNPATRGTPPSNDLSDKSRAYIDQAKKKQQNKKGN
jgi:hypothetical protein